MKKGHCPKCNSTKINLDQKGLICKKCGFTNLKNEELKSKLQKDLDSQNLKINKQEKKIK